MKDHWHDTQDRRWRSSSAPVSSGDADAPANAYWLSLKLRMKRPMVVTHSTFGMEDASADEDCGSPRITSAVMHTVELPRRRGQVPTSYTEEELQLALGVIASMEADNGTELTPDILLPYDIRRGLQDAVQATFDRAIVAHDLSALGHPVMPLNIPALSPATQAVASYDFEKPFPLTHPIYAPGGDCITELKLRRLRAEDFVGLRKLKDDAAITIRLISRMTGIAETVVRKLDGDDYAAICNALGAEFEASGNLVGARLT